MTSVFEILVESRVSSGRGAALGKIGQSRLNAARSQEDGIWHVAHLQLLAIRFRRAHIQSSASLQFVAVKNSDRRFAGCLASHLPGLGINLSCDAVGVSGDVK